MTPTAAATIGWEADDAVGRSMNDISQTPPAEFDARWRVLHDQGWFAGASTWHVPLIGDVYVRFIVQRDVPIPGRHTVLVHRWHEPAPTRDKLADAIREAFPERVPTRPHPGRTTTGTTRRVLRTVSSSGRGMAVMDTHLPPAAPSLAATPATSAGEITRSSATPTASSRRRRGGWLVGVVAVSLLSATLASAGTVALLSGASGGNAPASAAGSAGPVGTTAAVTRTISGTDAVVAVADSASPAVVTITVDFGRDARVRSLRRSGDRDRIGLRVRCRGPHPDQ